MSADILVPEPMTAESFSDFGQLIEFGGADFELINRGQTRKYTDLAALEITSGRPAVHVFESLPVALPFSVRSLERHPLGSQAFIPMHNRPFPVVVAPGDDEPEVERIRLFITNGRQGINLSAGTWHHHLISISEACRFVVIDRQGPGVNCDEWTLEDGLVIQRIEP